MRHIPIYWHCLGRCGHWLSLFFSRCDVPQTESPLFLPLAPLRNVPVPDCVALGSAQDLQLVSTVVCDEGRRQLLLNWTLPFSSETDNGPFTCVLNTW